MKTLPRFRTIILLILALVLPWGGGAHAYSLLTHEQLIDLTWQDSIVPLLLSHYPTLTPLTLEQCAGLRLWRLRDPGYWLLPVWRCRNFSNLTHYVRSGDFRREPLPQCEECQ
jgi:hypothetical protein